MCKVYTGYHGTSEIEHGLCACTLDNPLAKAWGLSFRTGAHVKYWWRRRYWDYISAYLIYSYINGKFFFLICRNSAPVLHIERLIGTDVVSQVS